METMLPVVMPKAKIHVIPLGSLVVTHLTYDDETSEWYTGYLTYRSSTKIRLLRPVVETITADLPVGMLGEQIVWVAEPIPRIVEALRVAQIIDSPSGSISPEIRALRVMDHFGVKLERS